MIANSFFWVGASSALSRSLTMLTTLILAGILTPDNFGVVSVANLITASLGLFRDFGMNQAIIYQKKNVSQAADTAMVLSVSASLVLFIAAYFLAGSAAVFFHNPAVEDVMKVLPFSLVITAFSTIPTSLLEKEMDFKKRALPEVLSFLTYFLVSITLAKLGFSYWSIIFGYLALCIVGLVVTFIVSPWHPTLRFHRPVLRDLFGFGSYAMLSSIVVFVFRNVDSFSVGRILGTTPLGFYDMAYRVGNVTTTQIGFVMSKVLYPAFTKMGDDIQQIRNSFLRVYRWLAIVNIPLTIGIILYTPYFFHLFYGNKWDHAILPAQILAVYGLFRSLFSHAGSLLMSIGKIKEVFWINLGELTVMLILIVPVIGAYDLVGLTILIVLLSFGVIAAACVILENSLSHVVKHLFVLLIRPLVVSSFVVVLPLTLWLSLMGEVSIFSFFSLIIFSIVLYVALMLLIFRDLRRELRDIVRALLSRQ
jgi:lipopolysaccharide exporter